MVAWSDFFLLASLPTLLIVAIYIQMIFSIFSRVSARHHLRASVGLSVRQSVRDGWRGFLRWYDDRFAGDFKRCFGASNFFMLWIQKREKILTFSSPISNSKSDTPSEGKKKEARGCQNNFLKTLFIAFEILFFRWFHFLSEEKVFLSARCSANEDLIPDAHSSFS